MSEEKKIWVTKAEWDFFGNWMKGKKMTEENKDKYYTPEEDFAQAEYEATIIRSAWIRNEDEKLHADFLKEHADTVFDEVNKSPEPGLNVTSYRWHIWEKHITPPFKIKDNEGNPIVRVKYLDRHDIEECGWKIDEDFQKDEERRKIFHREIIYRGQATRCSLFYIPRTNWALIFLSNKMHGAYMVEMPENKISFMGGTLFAGEIKNKSELKKLMQQLQIT